VFQEEFRAREEAKRKLFEYIEIFYNHQCLHSFWNTNIYLLKLS